MQNPDEVGAIRVDDECAGDRPLRGAIVGFGNVALHAHWPMWNQEPRFRIEALVEPSPERAPLARGSLPGIPVYSELGPLFERHRLDFIDVCSPPAYHAEQVAAACGHGLHVFCEKPLVTNLPDLKRIRDAARAAGRTVFTVNNWRHAPIWAKVLELVRGGRIGAVRSVDLNVLRPPQSGGGATNWRRSSGVAGGGILLDHGWHHLYLLRAILERRPLSVEARMTYSATDPRIEEEVALALRFDGATASLHLTWLADRRENCGTVVGDRGEIRINDDHLILSGDNGTSPTRYGFGEALSGCSHHVGWMNAVAQDFVREVTDPSARGANLEEAHWCAQVIDLAYRSQRKGSRRLRVDDEVEWEPRTENSRQDEDRLSSG